MNRHDIHPLRRATLAALLGSAVFAIPAQAETLRVGIRELAGAQGNPYSGGIQSPGSFTWSAIYEQLTQNGEGGVSQPLLATGWKNIDPTTWEFTLRPGVKFSNGEVFDANAVKASYDFVLKTDAGKASSTGKNVGVFIADVIVRDPMTIQVKTHRPAPLTPKLLQPVTILPPKALADEGLTSFVTNARGTGPFVGEYRQERVVGTPNPHWRGQKTNVDRIEWSVLAEGASRAQALLSNQIDIDVLLSRDSLPEATRAGIKVVTKRATRTLGLTFVTTRKAAPDRPSEPIKGPLSDVRVRQALNHAVNKDAIVQNIFGGGGAPATQSAPSVVNGFNKNLKPYEYDPAKAKRLLAEAGYPNGFEMDIRAIMTDTAISQVYQAAVQDIERIGIRAKLLPQQFPEWIKFYLEGTWPYDAFGFGHDLTTQLDASQAFLQYTSCKKNPPYYCNAEEMKLVEQVEVEFDEPKRLALLAQLLEMNRNNAPIIYLIEFDEVMAHSPKVQGFDHVNQWISYEKISLKR
jgi:peptide/nickel transport system substrate-binding protein